MVVGVVPDDVIEPPEVEDQVEPGRRVAELEGVTATPRHDGQLRVPGQGEHTAHLVERRRPNDPARGEAVHGGARAGRPVVHHGLLAHDRRERAPDRASEDAHARPTRLRAGGAAPGGTPRRRPDARGAAYRDS